MKTLDRTKSILPFLAVIVLAAAAPNAFPAAQAGYASLHDFGLYVIVPAALLLAATATFGRRGAESRLAAAISRGALAGAAATLALELVRYPGFLLGFMPGNLPELMGVLLLDRFVEGPSLASTFAGFAYHFWNGACFGIIFAALAEIGIVRRNTLWTIAYALLIGVSFLASPVVESLGGGFLGQEFGLGFTLTVLVAHAAFGAALGTMLRITATRAQLFDKNVPKGVCSTF